MPVCALHNRAIFCPNQIHLLLVFVWTINSFVQGMIKILIN
jgi:hypothetical protein